MSHAPVLPGLFSDDPPVQRQAVRTEPFVPLEQAEVERRASAKDRILSYLQAKGSASNTELAHVGGLRFGGRLHELRRDGWLITDAHVGGGLWRYTLIGRKAGA